MSQKECVKFSGSKTYTYSVEDIEKLKSWVQSHGLQPNSIIEIPIQDALTIDCSAKCFKSGGIAEYYRPSGDKAQYLSGCEGHFYLSMSANNDGNTYSFHMCRPDYEDGISVVNHDTVTMSERCNGDFVCSATKVHHAPSAVNPHEPWSVFESSVLGLSPNTPTNFSDLTPAQSARFVGSHDFDNQVLEKCGYFGCFSSDVDVLKKGEIEDKDD